ncbi:MAG: hypothetical protein AAFX09_09470 [Pseudomonadota bacterium]
MVFTALGLVLVMLELVFAPSSPPSVLWIRLIIDVALLGLSGGILTASAVLFGSVGGVKDAQAPNRWSWFAMGFRVCFASFVLLFLPTALFFVEGFENRFGVLMSGLLLCPLLGLLLAPSAGVRNRLFANVR